MVIKIIYCDAPAYHPVCSDQGVYVFPCLTLLGYDTKEEPLKKLQQLGFRVGDEDSRYEGVEIKQSSPFKLMRALAKECGYRPLKAVNSVAPGGLEIKMT